MSNKEVTIFWMVVGLIILGLFVYGYKQARPRPVGPTKSQAQIEVEPKLVDFGPVDYGQVLEYVFKVKNLGSQVLEIRRLATSCACTSAHISQTSLEPQAEAELKVVYQTKLMSGPQSRGEQERIIFIQSSDPNNPQVEVKIKAYVK